MALSTDFKDDILNESVNTKRKYNVIHNNDGTESYEDVTSYSQTGSQYGAKEVIEEREAINQLQKDVSSLNSAFAKSNMDVVWVNQKGTYIFSLPIGKMAVVITYHGIYPHYHVIETGIIQANQLGGNVENENVITSVNNSQGTVSVYNKGDGATQAVILMPR